MPATAWPASFFGRIRATCARCRLRQPPAQPRVVGDLDRELERLETRLQVERHRGRMVEGAGVEPHPPGPVAEGSLQRPVHQEARRAGADLRRRHPEERDLHLALDPSVELGDADRFAVALQGMDLAQGVAEKRRELRLRHHQRREPQPLLADQPDRGPVPADVRLRDTPEDEVRPVRSGPVRRRRQHLQIGDDIGDLPRGQVGIAVEADLKGFHRFCLARLAGRMGPSVISKACGRRRDARFAFRARIAPTAPARAASTSDGMERPGPEPRSCPKPCWSWKTTSST